MFTQTPKSIRGGRSKKGVLSDVTRDILRPVTVHLLDTYNNINPIYVDPESGMSMDGSTITFNGMSVALV